MSDKFDACQISSVNPSCVYWKPRGIGNDLLGFVRRKIVGGWCERNKKPRIIYSTALSHHNIIVSWFSWGSFGVATAKKGSNVHGGLENFFPAQKMRWNTTKENFSIHSFIASNPTIYFFSPLHPKLINFLGILSNSQFSRKSWEKKNEALAYF